MEYIRKQFSQADYINNNKVFKFLEADINKFNADNNSEYKVYLREEDYGIDAVLYYKDILACYFELEVKTQNAGNWEKGNYPYPDIHCLYRKDHLIFEDAVPFWICYNYDGSDCVTIPMETIPNFPLAKNKSKVEDLVHVVPTEAFVFGNENIIKYVEAYTNNQIPVYISLEEKYSLMNHAFRCRHGYDKVKNILPTLIKEMQTNKSRVGISGYV